MSDFDKDELPKAGARYYLQNMGGVIVGDVWRVESVGEMDTKSESIGISQRCVLVRMHPHREDQQP